MNYCEKNPKTCQNDGKCTSITEDEGSFKCECPSGFKGKSCEVVPMIANITLTITTTTTTTSPKPLSNVKPSQPQIVTTTFAESDGDLTDDLEENNKNEEKPMVDDEINNEA